LKIRAGITIALLLASLIALTPATSVSGQADEPKNIDLYLNGDPFGGDLTPIPPGRKIALDAATSGNPLIPTLVGSWITEELATTISVFGPVTASVWIKSNDEAKNAWIELEIFADTTKVGEFNSTKLDLTSTPIELIITGNLNVDLVGGEQLSIRLYFYSDMKPSWPLPVPADATVLYGGGKYKSKVSVRTSPVTIEIPEPEVDKNVDYVGLRIRVIEAFNVDPAKLTLNLTVQGPSFPKHLSNMSVTDENEYVVLMWDWYFLKDKAKDGDYTFMFMLSYDGNLTFTNTTKYYIDFPTKAVTQIEDTPWQDMAMPALIIVIAIVVLYMIYMKRSGKLDKALRRMRKKRARKKAGKSKRKAREEE
jgi:hypothetical protein